jgi:hypothetical protein
MNDVWTIIILLATALEKGDTLLKLIQSDDFDRDYSEIVNNLIAIDPIELKAKMLATIMAQKDKVKEINRANKRKEKKNDKANY